MVLFDIERLVVAEQCLGYFEIVDLIQVHKQIAFAALNPQRGEYAGHVRHEHVVHCEFKFVLNQQEIEQDRLEFLLLIVVVHS